MKTNLDEIEADLYQWDNICKYLGGYEYAECLFNSNNIHNCFYLENQEECKNFKSKIEV